MSDVDDITKAFKQEEKYRLIQTQLQDGNKKHEEVIDPFSIFKEKNLDTTDKNSEFLIKDCSHIDSIVNSYRTIFENYSVAITLVDKNEKIVSWNKYTEELFGFGERELFLKPVHTLYPALEWKKIRNENVRQKGIKYSMEIRMIKSNYKLFDAELSLCVLKSEKGKIIGSIGIIKDITKQKEMERALEKYEKRFKELYEKAPVPYHTLSPEGIITDVNEVWCKILGYKKNEVIGKSIFNFVQKNERAVAKKSFENKLLSRQQYSDANERVYITKKGEKRIFVIHDFFSLDEKNNITAVYTIMDDVTELKKAKKILKKIGSVNENAVKLQKIIDKAEEGITLSDAYGHFEIYNSNMYKITGYSMKEANACDDFTLLLYPDLDERNKSLDNLNRILKYESSNNFKTSIHTKNGTRKTLLVSTSTMKIDKELMFLSVYRDITETNKI